eukprot:6155207-Pyramimonas_sp.AAC.1
MRYEEGWAAVKHPSKWTAWRHYLKGRAPGATSSSSSTSSASSHLRLLPLTHPPPPPPLRWS